MNKFLLILIISFLCGAEFKSSRQYGIEQQLHAPCCWGGVIADHDSPQAVAIKAIINDLINPNFEIENVNISLRSAYENENIIDYAKSYFKNNMTDEEIVNFFVGIHGEKIRALPENKGLGWVAWKLPTFLLFLSILIGLIVVRNFRKNAIEKNENISRKKFKNVDKAMEEMGI